MVKKHKVDLNDEEQATLDAFEKALESGTIKSIPHVKDEMKRFKAMAQASGNKAKRVSLRMTEWDFNKAQEAALREGMPYQTLLASVVHKYLSGQLIQKHE
jgi:predicted DNA binding CopG/RHH family protein